jgi:hypothetical protein
MAFTRRADDNAETAHERLLADQPQTAPPITLSDRSGLPRPDRRDGSIAEVRTAHARMAGGVKA